MKKLLSLMLVAVMMISTMAAPALSAASNTIYLKGDQKGNFNETWNGIFYLGGAEVLANPQIWHIVYSGNVDSVSYMQLDFGFNGLFEWEKGDGFSTNGGGKNPGWVIYAPADWALVYVNNNNNDQSDSYVVASDSGQFNISGYNPGKPVPAPTPTPTPTLTPTPTPTQTPTPTPTPTLIPIPIYTVTFDSGGGSDVPGQNVVFGNTVQKPADPTRDGYEFLGWYVDPVATDPSHITLWDFAGCKIPPFDFTLYAHWTIAKFSLTFNYYGGPLPNKTILVEYDELIPVSTLYMDEYIPTRVGYDFMGWWCNDISGGMWWDVGSTRMPPYNVTLFATWEINKYTVTYDRNNGTGFTTSEQKNHGDKATYYNIDNERAYGWSFGGWYTDAAGNNAWDFYDPVTADMTLYAKWIGDPVTVLYDLTEVWPYTWPDTTKRVGDIADMQYNIGQEFTGTVDGSPYVFYGWYHDATRAIPYYHSYAYPESILAGDKTLYAKWLPKYITVNYHFGMSAPLMVWSDMSIEFNASTGQYNPPQEYWSFGYLQNGYTFIGWYDDSALTIPHDFSLPAYDGLNLYAAWIP